MASEEEAPNPMPTAENGDTGNLPTRRASIAAANRFKRLSSDKGQIVSVAGNGDGQKAMESALKSLNEPRKTLEGTVKALKRMSITKETNADRASPAKLGDGSLGVSEQGNRKLANAFRKLGKAQMGLSSLV